MILDEERAPLVKWALLEYATGDWSLLRLRDELERKELRTRPRKSSPAKPLSLNGLYHLLHNPYYAGIVLYKGAYFYSRNKGHGGIYEYFCCLNRHAKRRPCSRKYYRLQNIEAGIEHFYGTFQLRPQDVRRLRAVVRHELRIERARAEEQATRAARSVQRAKDQQAKLGEAHYEGAVPLDLLKVEMDRVARGRANAEAELKLATATLYIRQDGEVERVDSPSRLPRCSPVIR